MKIVEGENINLKNGEDETSVKVKQSGERLVNEKYETWKNQIPFYYDLIISHGLDCPSLTVEWLPERVDVPDRNYSLQKVIIGTHADDNEPNYLIIAQVKLPLMDDWAFDEGYGNLDREDDRDHLKYGAGRKIEVLHQIPHDGEVKRARHMPQDPFRIATKTISSEIHIFDYKSPVGETSNPELRLTGHNSDGIGLSWSKLRRGLLLSGSNDSRICLWDINLFPVNKTIDILQTYKAHQGPVEDVSWHWKHDNLFASCGDDGYLHTFDLRCQLTRPIQSLIAHRYAINSLSFNPLNEFHVATGSTDKTIKSFDLRRFTSDLHTFKHHKDEVLQIEWSPHTEYMLASSSADTSLVVWDASRIGLEQTSKDAEKGPPEMLFVHDGHTNRVPDFSWNQSEDLVIASVSDDNMLQVWQMRDDIYYN